MQKVTSGTQFAEESAAGVGEVADGAEAGEWATVLVPVRLDPHKVHKTSSADYHHQDHDDADDAAFLFNTNK